MPPSVQQRTSGQKMREKTEDVTNITNGLDLMDINWTLLPKNR